MSRLRAALTAATVAVLAVVPAAAAHAVDVSWDGPTLSLAWDGSTRASAESSFVGVPVTVPGDRALRSVTVRNDGPAGGTVRAWVTRVDLLDAPQGADDPFYDDLRLEWVTASQSDGASFADLAEAGETLIAQTNVAQGASTRLEVAYALPAAATSGNRSEVGAREASFVVRVQIQGDTPAPAPAPTGGGVAVAPGASGGTAGPRPGSGVGALAITGLDALRAGLLAVVGIAAGSLLVGAARRRREVQNPGASGSTPDAR